MSNFSKILTLYNIILLRNLCLKREYFNRWDCQHYFHKNVLQNNPVAFFKRDLNSYKTNTGELRNWKKNAHHNKKLLPAAIPWYYPVRIFIDFVNILILRSTSIGIYCAHTKYVFDWTMTPNHYWLILKVLNKACV